jgi:hypothetical protein
MKVTLTTQQKQELDRQHGTTRDGRVRDRIKAVLLTSEGWSTVMLSQALRINETTVPPGIRILDAKRADPFSCPQTDEYGLGRDFGRTGE